MDLKWWYVAFYRKNSVPHSKPDGFELQKARTKNVAARQFNKLRANSKDKSYERKVHGPFKDKEECDRDYVRCYLDK